VLVGLDLPWNADLHGASPYLVGSSTRIRRVFDTDACVVRGYRRPRGRAGGTTPTLGWGVHAGRGVTRRRCAARRDTGADRRESSRPPPPANATRSRRRASG